MDDPFFRGAVQLADRSAYGGLRFYTGDERLAGFGNIGFDNRLYHAVVQAALLLLAHAFLCRGIIGHLSTIPPRNISPFTRVG